MKLPDIEIRIAKLVEALGGGRVQSVAYDAGWVARLEKNYPDRGFGASLDWLRRNQHPDGSWGAEVVHYHDRYVSTLSALIALREVGGGADDEARVTRGEKYLASIEGRLGEDDSDTVGFPIVSVSLIKEARKLGLKVPAPEIRFALAYEHRLTTLLATEERSWRTSPLAHSIEALRTIFSEGDDILASNGSAGISPAATAAVLMSHNSPPAFDYLQNVIKEEGDGGIPALAPIDNFEIAWALNHLRYVNALDADNPGVRQVLDLLWSFWQSGRGYSASSYFDVPDLDDTAAVFAALRWGGYNASPEVFTQYEAEDHFRCFPYETNPSVSAHVRLLLALSMVKDWECYKDWVPKIVNALRQMQGDKEWWWDKWHASPYYVNCVAVRTLQGIADDLVTARVDWIIKTQNPDGGWGYFGTSTPEETAYCLDALLVADKHVKRIPRNLLDKAAAFLESHVDDEAFTALWIGKSLYTPHYVVKAAVLSTLYAYMTHGGD